jgi:hypothetical protein
MNLSTETALASALLFGLHPVHKESAVMPPCRIRPAALFILSSLLLYEIISTAANISRSPSYPA